MKQKLLSATLLFLIFPFAWSQTDQQLDSILRVCSKLKDDTNKVIFQNEISWSFKYSHPKQTEKLLLDNVRLENKLNYNPGIALCYKNLGILMDEAGNIPKSRSARWHQQTAARPRTDQSFGNSHPAARQTRCRHRWQLPLS